MSGETSTCLPSCVPHTQQALGTRGMPQSPGSSDLHVHLLSCIPNICHTSDVPKPHNTCPVVFRCFASLRNPSTQNTCTHSQTHVWPDFALVSHFVLSSTWLSLGVGDPAADMSRADGYKEMKCPCFQSTTVLPNARGGGISVCTLMLFSLNSHSAGLLSNRKLCSET